MRRTNGWLMLLAVWAAPVFGAAAPDLVLDDSRDNARWTVDGAAASVTKDSDATPELEMKFAPFREGPITFKFTTDADHVKVKPGHASFRIDLSGPRHTLVLSAAKGKPQLIYNGQAHEALQEAWVESIASVRNNKIALRFGLCDSVEVSWRQGVAAHRPPEAAADPDETPAEPAEAVEPDGPVDADRALAVLRRGTLPLRLERAAEGVGSWATVVLVADRGLGLTHAHALHGATGGSVRIPGMPMPVGVEVVSIDTEHDLALVQLDLSHVQAAKWVAPLTLAQAEPGQGAAIWLSAHNAGRYDLAKAEVGGAATYAEMDSKYRQLLDHRPTSRWLLLGRPIGPAQSGAPVLNERGELVGLGAFTWSSRSRQGLVLSTAKAAALIERRPLLPITFAGAQEALAEADLPHTTYPRLHVETTRTALQLRRRVVLFNQSHPCAVCKGEPVVTRNVKVGYRQQGGMRVPVFEDRQFTCSRCKGTGLNDAKPLWRLAQDLVNAHAHAGASDPGRPDVVRFMRAHLRDAAEKHTVALTRLLAEQARPVLTGGPAVIGQPVMTIGALSGAIAVPGRAQPVVGIGFGRDSEPGVSLLVDGVTLDPKMRAKVALAGGLVAGFTRAEAGAAPTPILSHAFVIPLANPQDEGDVPRPQPRRRGD